MVTKTRDERRKCLFIELGESGVLCIIVVIMTLHTHSLMMGLLIRTLKEIYFLYKNEKDSDGFGLIAIQFKYCKLNTINCSNVRKRVQNNFFYSFLRKQCDTENYVTRE